MHTKLLAIGALLALVTGGGLVQADTAKAVHVENAVPAAKTHQKTFTAEKWVEGMKHGTYKKYTFTETVNPAATPKSVIADKCRSIGGEVPQNDWTGLEKKLKNYQAEKWSDGSGYTELEYWLHKEAGGAIDQDGAIMRFYCHKTRPSTNFEHNGRWVQLTGF